MILLISLMSALQCAELNFTIQSWQRDLGGLPQPTSLPQTIQFQLDEPMQAGTVNYEQQSVRLDGEDIQLKIYCVFPAPERDLPKYFNIEVSGRRFYCASSPRADKGGVPPLVCGTKSEHGTRGVTLIYQYD